jgi:hypothetical protein
MALRRGLWKLNFSISALEGGSMTQFLHIALLYKQNGDGKNPSE